MANNRAPSNAFSATNQPSLNGNTRGKATLTKYLRALKQANGWDEHDLMVHVVTQAFVANDREYRDIFFKHCYSAPKPQSQPVEFQYDRSAAYHEKCEVILEAVSKGEIAPDVGQDLIASIKHISQVKEITDLEQRLHDLEDLIRGMGGL
jgi:methanogenic corrinoid protein MtbC1